MLATLSDILPAVRRSSQTGARTAALILGSERLVEAIPAADRAALDALCVAYETATRSIEAARSLPAPPDVAAEIDVACRAGRVVDLVKLESKLPGFRVHADRRGRVSTTPATEHLRAILENTAVGYIDEIVRVVTRHTAACYGVLDDALADLLDRAERIVADLDGVDNPAAAFAAGRSEPWAAALELAPEMGAIRSEHAALLRLDNPSAFAPGAPALAHAYFAGLASVLPRFNRTITGEFDLMQRRLPVGLPVFEVDTIEHLLMSVRMRDTLRPVIGRSADAMAAAARPVVDKDPNPALSDDPSLLVQRYGSEAEAARTYWGDLPVASRIVTTPDVEED